MPAKPKRDPILVPQPLRSNFSRLTIHLDFMIAKERLANWRAAWSQGRKVERDRWGPFSSKLDPSLGLSVFNEKKEARGHSFHAVIEYRSNSNSPYPKIPHPHFRAFVDCLQRDATEIRVTSWSQAKEHPLKGQLAQDLRIPQSSLMVEPSGYSVRTVGLEMAFEKEGEPPLFLALRWNPKAVTITESTKGVRFDSLGDLFGGEKPVITMPDLKSLTVSPSREEVEDAKPKE